MVGVANGANSSAEGMHSASGMVAAWLEVGSTCGNRVWAERGSERGYMAAAAQHSACARAGAVWAEIEA